MRRIYPSDDSLCLTIDTADNLEVVFDRERELPVIEIRNLAFVETPKYLAISATEPERYIAALIEALASLQAALKRA
jgi:hypothetical protein